MKYLNTSKNILGVSFLLLHMNVYADTSNVPYCQANQLQIYEVASGDPGMCQTHFAFAVINHSDQLCRLNGTPKVWGVSSTTGKIYASSGKAVANSNNVVLQPIGSRDYEYASDLVWFSFGADDCTGDQDTDQDYDRVNVELPGIPNYFFNVSYDGYFNLWDVSTIQKGIQTWEDITTGGICDGWNGKDGNYNYPNHEDWIVHFKNEVECY